jgi:hypothetical protein
VAQPIVCFRDIAVTGRRGKLAARRALRAVSQFSATSFRIGSPGAMNAG